MIGTKILKIDKEIPKIIEFKVGTIFFQPKNFQRKLKLSNFESNYLRCFWINLENFGAYHEAFFI